MYFEQITVLLFIKIFCANVTLKPLLNLGQEVEMTSSLKKQNIKNKSIISKLLPEPCVAKQWALKS